VRKFTAIFLFTALFTSQYAKYAGYLECRFARYFSQSPSCDCEKWLTIANANDPQPATPFLHQHYHLDELFVLFENGKQERPGDAGNILYLRLHIFYLPDGICRMPDRPPEQFSPAC
jgi:hypothetical protein